MGGTFPLGGIRTNMTIVAQSAIPKNNLLSQPRLRILRSKTLQRGRDQEPVGFLSTVGVPIVAHDRPGLGPPTSSHPGYARPCLSNGG
jgi:hypothetical protein